MDGKPTIPRYLRKFNNSKMNNLKIDLREKINKGTEKNMLKILNDIILRKMLEDFIAGCCEKETNNYYHKGKTTNKQKGNEKL